MPAEDMRRRPSCSATRERLLSTVLQGFYQSNQATAAACQVNNVHLLRGMIGRPGAGVLQMNGQPTAQNTRETGADGDLPGHAQLGQPRPRPRAGRAVERRRRRRSRTGRRRPTRCRSGATPSRARSSCCGSRRPTRPSRCPTWPDPRDPRAGRTSRRRPGPLPDRDGALADVVLPAAGVGREDRARSPTPTAPCICPSRPSSRRARRAPTWRSSSTTRGGWTSATATATPLISGSDAEGAFEAWKECSRGRPCDYTGLTYDAAARPRRHPVAVHRASARRHRAALRRRRLQHRPRTTARPTATTSTTGASRTASRVPRQGARTVARSCRPRAYAPAPTRRPTTSTRSC